MELRRVSVARAREHGWATAADDAAYRRAVSVANVIVMPLDEPSIAYWHGLDDAGRRERILPFAMFLRSRYLRAQVLVFFVALTTWWWVEPFGPPPRLLPISPSATRRCRWKKSSQRCWPLCRAVSRKRDVSNKASRRQDALLSHVHRYQSRSLESKRDPLLGFF